MAAASHEKRLYHRVIGRLARLYAARDDYAAIACKTWMDVRAFGQVFSFKKGGENESISIGIRGPVTIQPAFSIAPVNIVSSQITKSVNLETGSNPDKKNPDTMGMKHRVEYGVYKTFGSINVQTAQKTGFDEEDAEAIKEFLIRFAMESRRA